MDVSECYFSMKTTSLNRVKYTTVKVILNITTAEMNILVNKSVSVSYYFILKIKQLTNANI